MGDMLVTKWEDFETLIKSHFYPIVYVEVLKYCNFKGYSKCILRMYPKGDVIIPPLACYYCNWLAQSHEVKPPL